MGAWGHNKFANDTALDWLGCLQDHLEPRLRKTLERDNDSEIRVAAAFMIDLVNFNETTFLVSEDFQKLLKVFSSKLHALYENQDYINQWEEPHLLRKELEQEIQAMDLALEKAKSVEDSLNEVLA